MTTDELLERIRLGEDSRTEFKQEEARPDSLAEAIVSLANSGGGALILGVGNDRSIQGVSSPDKLMLKIDHVARQDVEPPFPYLTVEKHGLQGKTVLVAVIPRGPQRPYRTNRGLYYVRGPAGKKPATRQELLELYQGAQSLFTDEMTAEDAGFDSIDRDYVLELWPELRAFSEKEFTRALKARKILADDEHPSVGGLLCFGKAPEKIRPYFRVTAIRQQGTQITENFEDRSEIGGSVHVQIAQAQSFVRKHVPGVGAGPRPLYAFPVEAVDQALINAVAHRDYLMPAQVRLFIFDDRVEVISPGRLLNSVTTDLMRLGYHLPRNPMIFSHLARLRIATEAARGVPHMIELMRSRALPEPELAVVGAEFRVVFRTQR